MVRALLFCGQQLAIISLKHDSSSRLVETISSSIACARQEVQLNMIFFHFAHFIHINLIIHNYAIFIAYSFSMEYSVLECNKETLKMTTAHMHRELLRLPEMQTDTRPGYFLWSLFKAWISIDGNTLDEFLNNLIKAEDNEGLSAVKSANSKLYGKVKTSEADTATIIFSVLNNWPDEVRLNEFLNNVFSEKKNISTTQLVDISLNLARMLFLNENVNKIIIEPKIYRSPKEFFVEAGRNSNSIIIPTPSGLTNQFSGWQIMKDVRELITIYMNESANADNEITQKPKYIWLFDLKKPPRTEPDTFFFAPYYAFLIHIFTLISWCSIEWHRDLDLDEDDQKPEELNLKKWREILSDRIIIYVKNLPYPFRNYSSKLLSANPDDPEIKAPEDYKYIRNLLHDLETNWDLIPKEIPETFVGSELKDKIDTKRSQLLITAKSNPNLDKEAITERLERTVSKELNLMDLKYWLSPYQEENTEKLPNVYETKQKPIEALDKAYRCIFMSADYLLNNEDNPKTEGYQFTKMLCEVGWYPLRVVDLFDILQVPKNDEGI